MISFLRDPDPSTRDRILFATNMWPTDDRPYYGSFIRSQAESVRAAGWPVDVIYVRGYQSRSAYARALAAIPKHVRKGSYSLLHVHYGHTLGSSLLVRGLPVLASFCGGDLLGTPRGDEHLTMKSRLEASAFRQLARRATRTITKSQEMEMVLPASLRSRNHVLPNGVNTERFRWRDTDGARAELGWDVAGKVMLFLGNPSDPRKNIRLAQEAERLVVESVPDARIVVVWKMPEDRVPLAMNAADVLLFPSLSEGSPNAVKEAMASELPIVATPVGDVPERLDGVAGGFVTRPEPRAFAEGILEALEFGRAPEERTAIASLSVGQVAHRLLEIYVATRTDYLETKG